MESFLPDYGKTMDAHDNDAAKYPTQTMVQAARTPNFSIPQPPAGSGTGSRSQDHRSALLTIVRSIWNRVAKVATFVH